MAVTRRSPLLPILLVSALLSLIGAISAPPRGNSVLVVGDTADVQTTHSQILQTVRDAGRQVTFKSATEKSLPITLNGEYIYDAIILLAPRSTMLSSKLSVSKLTAFVDSGRDLLVTSSSGYSAHAEKMAEELGIDLDEGEAMLSDHQRTVRDANGSNWISIGGAAPKAFGKLSAFDPKRVIFRGVAGTLFKDNELVTPLMWGGDSCFGAKRGGAPLRKIPRVSGTGAVLAASVSTRANSRGTWFGSFEALEDTALEYSEGHAQAMKRLVLWAISEYNVLRIGKVTHQRVGDDAGQQTEYRVKDVVQLSVHVNEWDGNNWRGYEAEDIQAELVMLNPWVRTRLVQEEPGVFRAEMQVPDQIGVYKVRVEYVRRGVSSLFYEEVVPVRPFLHNEYERFIPMASPYYVACFSTVAASLALGLVLLYGGGDETTREKAA